MSCIRFVEARFEEGSTNAQNGVEDLALIILDLLCNFSVATSNSSDWILTEWACIRRYLRFVEEEEFGWELAC